jgi:hypothetical protein
MMKNILVLAFILTFPIVSSAQNYDSLVQKIVSLEQRVNTIDLNMRSAHDQFRTGTYFIVAGALATVVAPLIIEGSHTEDSIKSSPMLYVVGGIALTTGVVLQIDAHKFIGRGSKKKRRN